MSDMNIDKICKKVIKEWCMDIPPFTGDPADHHPFLFLSLVESKADPLVMCGVLLEIDMVLGFVAAHFCQVNDRCEASDWIKQLMHQAPYILHSWELFKVAFKEKFGGKATIKQKLRLLSEDGLKQREGEPVLAFYTRCVHAAFVLLDYEAADVGIDTEHERVKKVARQKCHSLLFFAGLQPNMKILVACENPKTEKEIKEVAYRIGGMRNKMLEKKAGENQALSRRTSLMEKLKLHEVHLKQRNEESVSDFHKRCAEASNVLYNIEVSALDMFKAIGQPVTGQQKKRINRLAREMCAGVSFMSGLKPNIQEAVAKKRPKTNQEFMELAFKIDPELPKPDETAVGKIDPELPKPDESEGDKSKGKLPSGDVTSAECAAVEELLRKMGLAREKEGGANQANTTSSD